MTIDTDLSALALEIEQRAPRKDLGDKQQPKRAVLPPDLPRTQYRHEPENTACRCGCQLRRIGKGLAEKLDYVPGVFTVERHIRGKWVCRTCETLVQAPVPAHIIDEGIPTTGLLAQVAPALRRRCIAPGNQGARLQACGHRWATLVKPCEDRIRVPGPN